jgi:hypothetical protein
MQMVHGQARPTFKDLNAVAAHALASLICPARLRSSSAGSRDRLDDARMPPKRMPGIPGSRASDAAHNSTAALAHLPAALGRQAVLGDILGQVGVLVERPCSAVLLFVLWGQANATIAQPCTIPGTFAAMPARAAPACAKHGLGTMSVADKLIALEESCPNDHLVCPEGLQMQCRLQPILHIVC